MDIVVHVRGGLGNRMCALVSAVLMGQTLGSAVTIVWERQAGCWATFDELLEPSSLPSIRWLRTAPHGVIWRQAEGLSEREFIAAVERQSDLFLYANGFFGPVLGEPDTLRKWTREILTKLRPVREVRELLALFPVARVGIHARRTDHLSCRAIAPTWCYIVAAKEILRRLPEERIYLTTDSISLAERVRAFAPDRIELLSAPFADPTGNRGTLSGIHHALADLLRLSRCDLIVATPHSTFSILAAYGSAGATFYATMVSASKSLAVDRMISRTRNRLSYEPATDSWRTKLRRREPVNPWIGLSDRLLAGVICSRSYQNLAWPIARERFTAKLNEFLDGAGESLRRQNSAG